ncbi:SCO-spondin-like isoform X2 [Dreissena polymorpha]|uniref:Uncharacterized protein n=2 Tax=Dreissena polymorpha TaxID=45954 RepID=A0A9D4K9B9_DREPO|nr:SCO-spondin-like isoform X2 [Dreissena polymorpha]KAH3835309.1 hypothetical protein DPMN_108660 [Dreissena polymorpha]
MASICVCTPSHEATPVYGTSDSLSEIVGHISTKTCLHGELVKGKDWLLLLGSSDYYIKIQKLIACPNDREEIEPIIIRMPKGTEANHNTDHKRFLLDSLNQAQCNFDVNSLCSWRNVHGLDDFDWVLYRSSTPTDDTGPDFDHTTRNYSGSYIFTESSAPRNLLDTAWIQSPTIDVTLNPLHCFRFWYHMYGSSIGRLNVYQVTNGGLPGKVVWSLTGDQGNSWKEGQVPLNSNQSYSILLSGVIGNGFQGDIAVDDINVSVGYCEVKPSSASRTDVTNTTTTTVGGFWVLWNPWTSCSVTCGGGSRNRTRECSSQIPQHGAYCVGNDTDTGSCNTHLCPVNGHWSAWGSWTACSVSCDVGQHTRNRTCAYDKVAPHGARCSGLDREVSFCLLSSCPPLTHPQTTSTTALTQPQTTSTTALNQPQTTTKSPVPLGWGEWGPNICLETQANIQGTRSHWRTCYNPTDKPGIGCYDGDVQEEIATRQFCYGGVGIPCQQAENVRIIASSQLSLGGKVTLQCIADGDPTPHVKWSTPKGTIWSRRNLVIDGVTKADEGEYVCHASNLCRYGTDIKDIETRKYISVV